MKTCFKSCLKSRWPHLVNEDGFTLIELMVVIVIIGLLTTIVVINVLPSQDKAMVEKAHADIHMLEQAVELYRLDNKAYPTVDQGLQALVKMPDNLKNPDLYRKEGYIKRLPNDPWGHPYQYAYPGEHGTFDIFSLGADGRVGGKGLDADVTNWQK
ncbi:type II secretion system major pseudopilin GspG [Kordiimonas marina]|uniref:type II secretion system major pseudopilin GspG n=1 Tax=Kordiimonas marina TaxID=2872312 RepID=UPI001FF634D5|nr:type II secretion system major pseudopilin GspG [Kordiimonas marina]